MVYRKLFLVGCPRSGTSWLTKMISRHLNIVRVPSESHAYSVIYHYFTYLKKQTLKKKIEISRMGYEILWFEAFVIRN
ncbi:sulfotransferase domain-containing protein [Dapis sp. BLCC M126]|uniref:sulfotransferase domain-containing protein n=1 Tax=Dapis sp. BLCC M126 TaxID=3400189 RepID=UPI003CED0C68